MFSSIYTATMPKDSPSINHKNVYDLESGIDGYLFSSSSTIAFCIWSYATNEEVYYTSLQFFCTNAVKNALVNKTYFVWKKMLRYSYFYFVEHLYGILYISYQMINFTDSPWWIQDRWKFIFLSDSHIDIKEADIWFKCTDEKFS